MKRVGKAAGDGSRIGKCQVSSGDRVVTLCCRLYTIQVWAKLGNIEVHFQDSVFAPYPFNQDGVVCLNAFSQPCVGTEGEAVLGCLLADGTAAADRGAVKHVLLFHLAKLIIVESVVVKELLVFSSYDGTDHIVGNALERNPCALERTMWSPDAFNAALDHEWSHCDRYPLQEGDQ